MSSSQRRHEKISSGVIDAVAEATETDPLDLHPPLFEAIDPDALDTLVASASAPLQIQFEYVGVQVTVEHTGTIQAEKPAPSQDSSHRKGESR